MIDLDETHQWETGVYFVEDGWFWDKPRDIKVLDVKNQLHQWPRDR